MKILQSTGQVLIVNDARRVGRGRHDWFASHGHLYFTVVPWGCASGAWAAADEWGLLHQPEEYSYFYVRGLFATLEDCVTFCDSGLALQAALGFPLAFGLGYNYLFRGVTPIKIFGGDFPGWLNAH